MNFIFDCRDNENIHDRDACITKASQAYRVLVAYVATILAPIALPAALGHFAFGQTNTATMNGTVSATTVQASTVQTNVATAGAINSAAQVDGIVNKSLAGAVASSQCFGVLSTSPNGCDIWDSQNELFQTWPLLGSTTYHLNLSKGLQGGYGNGNFYTTVPIIVSSSQVLGSGRGAGPSGALNAPRDGSTGTIIRACDGDCLDQNSNHVYFPNAPPPAPTPTLSYGSGNLNGQYYVRIAWVVNLASGCDSRPTSGSSGWPVYPTPGTGNMYIYAGECVRDNNSNASFCSGLNCTWMALNRGPIQTSTPSWTGTKGSELTDGGGVTWLNLGNYNASSSYGTPGISLPGPYALSSNLTNNSITITNAPTAVTAYPYCASLDTMQVNDGTYALGPSPADNHTYRAVGSGTISVANNSCKSGSMSTSPGSQTEDQGAPGIWWQEVGSPTNFLPVVGWIPYVGTSDGAETSQVTGCGSNTVQIGSIVACTFSASFTLTTLATLNVRRVPQIDTTAPLIVLGEMQNNVSVTATSTFMSRVQDLTADANNIAGEACLYLYSQEQSGCYGVNAVSGTEASIAAIGSWSQNAMIWDFTAGNPASGNKQQQRLAGVFVDSRDGAAMKTIAHGTITPYNSPASSAVAAGLEVIGAAAITIESIHTESVQDGILCDGDMQGVSSNLFAGCWILSTDSGTGVTANTVHLGHQVLGGLVSAANPPTGQGCPPTSVPCALEVDPLSGPPGTTYPTGGTYVVGQNDSSGMRTTLVPGQGALQILDGPLYLNNSTTAGALGFGQGNDLSPSNPFSSPSVIVEGPPSISNSYYVRLPSVANSGVLQTSLALGSPPVLTGSFSGDINHSRSLPTNTGPLSGTLCSASLGACNRSGLYRLSFYIYTISSSCTGASTVGPIEIGYTDNATSRSNVVVPLFYSGTVTSLLNLSTGTYAWGSATVWSKGSPNQIQYTVGFNCLGLGTSAIYEFDYTVEQIQ